MLLKWRKYVHIYLKKSKICPKNLKICENNMDVILKSLKIYTSNIARKIKLIYQIIFGIIDTLTKHNRVRDRYN